MKSRSGPLMLGACSLLLFGCAKHLDPTFEQGAHQVLPSILAYHDRPPFRNSFHTR